jgi:hypothetical protein
MLRIAALELGFELGVPLSFFVNFLGWLRRVGTARNE